MSRKLMQTSALAAFISAISACSTSSAGGAGSGSSGSGSGSSSSGGAPGSGSSSGGSGNAGSGSPSSGGASGSGSSSGGLGSSESSGASGSATGSSSGTASSDGSLGGSDSGLSASRGNAIAVAVGYNFACAITMSGVVECWGSDGDGLGRGDAGTSSIPVPVTGLTSGVTAISAQLSTVCALVGGGVECWGLGFGTSPEGATPSGKLSGLGSGVTAVSVEGDGPVYAITTGGVVQCAGCNLAISGLPTGVTAISAGGEYAGDSACAVTAGGGVVCWGQLALPSGELAFSMVPTSVPGLTSGVTAVSVASNNPFGNAGGGGFACALTAGGGVVCWQDGGTPSSVQGLTSGVTAVAAGNEFACALTTGGGVQCWGNNANLELGGFLASGQLSSSVPVQIPGLTSGVTAISAGYNCSCAVTAGGGVVCWGSCYAGQSNHDGAPTQIMGI
jgi:Regulator of Chromosome Condensation (RCC1) repeat protein